MFSGLHKWQPVLVKKLFSDFDVLENESESDTLPKCNGCDNENEACCCDETLSMFQQVNSQL